MAKTTARLEKKLVETDPLPKKAPITSGRPGLESVVDESDRNEIKRSVKIWQFANEVPAPTGREDEARTWYDVIYTVKVKIDNDQLKEKYNGINLIKEVAYNFNKRWYRPSRRIRRNSRDDFRLSVRVWGRTSVDVEVFLVGFNEPICKKGFMSLETEPVVYTEECETR